MEINMSTGNAIVDAVSKINFTGNIIPEAWYKTIVNENGKPNLLAINLLAEIVYWYRPKEERDENHNVVSYKKKFKAELLQKSYDQLQDKYNISKDQARAALKRLEALGVVTRRPKMVKTPYGVANNVLFIELNPEVLKTLTFPTVEDTDNHEGGGEKKSTTPPPEKQPRGDQKRRRWYQ